MFSHQLKNLESIKCQKVVQKRLPHCEHSKQVACCKDPASITCAEPCDKPMGCCSRKCNGRCGECQTRSLNVGEVRLGLIARVNHIEHPCKRVLYCQHLCGNPCHHEDKGCNSECKQPCRQRCVHRTCPEPCSAICPPCLEACPWRCEHHECPVACGSVRWRLLFDSLSLKYIPRSVPDFRAMNRVPSCSSVIIPVHPVSSPNSSCLTILLNPARSLWRTL